MPPLVDLHRIVVRRPGALILREVTMSLAPGEAVGLFGANGSGKTTLLRVIATLERLAGGAGNVLGADLGSDDIEAVRPRIGLIGHQPALFSALTLHENMRLIAALAGLDPARADAALADVGLEAAAARLAADCSNGMRRRAEFARLLLTSPDLLLLDEAHVGLDAAASDLVELLVSMATDRGGAAVLVSHEQERIRALIHRSITLSDGTLVAP